MKFIKQNLFILLLFATLTACHSSYNTTATKDLEHTHNRMEKLIGDLSKTHRNVYYRASHNTPYGLVWLHTEEGIIVYQIDPVVKLEPLSVPRNHQPTHYDEVFVANWKYPTAEGQDIIGFKSRELEIGQYLDVSLLCELFGLMSIKYPESDVLTNQLQKDYATIITFLKDKILEENLNSDQVGRLNPLYKY